MSREAVVLVHGLWTGPWVFAALRARLREAGYATHGFAYPSVRAPLEASARSLARFLGEIEADTIHLVAHSLGGIVVHEGLLLHPCRGRVVLLGTPWRGSFAARELARLPLGAKLRGRCLEDWLAAPHAQWQVPNSLGIIAGTRGLGLGRLVAPALPLPNDGAVSLEETCVDGATDSLALPVAHSAMLLSARVARETINFLRRGRFGDGIEVAR